MVYTVSCILYLVCCMAYDVPPGGNQHDQEEADGGPTGGGQGEVSLELRAAALSCLPLILLILLD